MALFVSCKQEVKKTENKNEKIELKKEKPKKFSISIENTAYGFELHSFKGSTWVDLSLSLKMNGITSVNEFGTSSLTDQSDLKPNYQFTLSKTSDGIHLLGIEGTHWEELKYKLAEGEKMLINEFGIADK
jgi:protein tyrosine phosphatase